MVPSFHLIDNVIQDGDQDTSTIDPPEEGDGSPEGGDEGEYDLEEGETEDKSDQPEQKEKRQRGYRYNKRFNC
jgi:hypothetical protein